MWIQIQSRPWQPFSSIYYLNLFDPLRLLNYRMCSILSILAVHCLARRAILKLRNWKTGLPTISYKCRSSVLHYKYVGHLIEIVASSTAIWNCIAFLHKMVTSIEAKSLLPIKQSTWPLRLLGSTPVRGKILICINLAGTPKQVESTTSSAVKGQMTLMY